VATQLKSTLVPTLKAGRQARDSNGLTVIRTMSVNWVVVEVVIITGSICRELPSLRCSHSVTEYGTVWKSN